jgi:signal peptidase II
MTAKPLHRAFGFALAALVYLIDQAVKFVMIHSLALESRQVITLAPILNLSWVENHGISLGMFTASSDAQRWILIGVTAAIAMGVSIWLLREQLRGDVYALGLVLGGALGNITDRARFGYVVDFIDLHFGDFRPFLVFNVADAAITIGVLLLLVRAFLTPDKMKDGETENA